MMWTSGWWSAASAASATAPTSWAAAEKPATRTVRRIWSPSRDQSGRSASAAVSSASVSGSAYGIGSGGSRLADEAHELGPGPGVATERSGHGGSDHRRLLLLHPTHHRAQMRGLHDARDALRLEPLHEEVGDLDREPLLHLESMRVHVDDAWDLRQPDHPALRQVADVRLADERQQVVIAQAEDLYVAHDEHHVC